MDIPSIKTGQQLYNVTNKQSTGRTGWADGSPAAEAPSSQWCTMVGMSLL